MRPFSRFFTGWAFRAVVTQNAERVGEQSVKQHNKEAIRVKQCEQKIHYQFSQVSAVRIATLEKKKKIKKFNNWLSILSWDDIDIN